jgi:hypothetical protein
LSYWISVSVIALLGAACSAREAPVMVALPAAPAISAGSVAASVPAVPRVAIAVFPMLAPSVGVIEDPSRCGSGICPAIVFGAAEPSSGTRRVVPALRLAAERCALREPLLTRSTLMLKLKVLPNGEVGAVDYAGDEAANRVVECLVREAMSLSFEPPAGGGANPVFVFVVGG